MSSVSFFSNCYEGDWRAIILEGGYVRKVDNLNYPFSERNLIINNVNNRNLVEVGLNKLIEQKVIDNYFFSEDYSKEVLDFFDIDLNSFNGGYWYSIAPLLSIYMCKSDYLVYLTADSITEKSEYNWILEGIKLLENNKKVKVINPIWNLQFSAAKDDENYYINLGNELEEKSDEWFFGMGFSDQCFLIETEVFNKRIYNEKNHLSDMQYPGYAGDSFEKRVSSHLKNNKFYRVSSNITTYYHPRYF